MNQERLLKIIEDLAEVIKNLNNCMNVLKSTKETDTTIFIEFGLKQIFVDYFILAENLTSMILKELKQFKVGIDMKDSLAILKDSDIVNENIYLFLNQTRLLRNRISHRYKEPSREELLQFINGNIEKFDIVLELAKSYMK